MEKYNEKKSSNVYEKFHGIPWKIPGVTCVTVPG
jgi:hypothetical protein